jgi:hypothetical protein
MQWKRRKKRNARQVENSPYILTGVLRCGFCGGAMTGHTQSKNNAKGERVCLNMVAAGRYSFGHTRNELAL